MSRSESIEAKKQLDELIEKGKVQTSRSEWASPTLFVNKGDGSKRWCMDLRLLNNITTTDANQAPLQETAKEKLQGAKYFTKLDMRDGYHHLRIKKGDEHKTAFLTEFGLYEWKVMCFGLKNAPAEFARYMTANLHDFINDYVAVYFDDIIIYSKDLKSHWRHVRNVLERLREKRINFKLKKCVFAAQEVPYLGHIIDGSTTKMQEEKRKAIMNWPTPSMNKDIEEFRGLAGYYRQYVEKFSHRIEPLNERLRMRTFFWGEKEEKAFNDIKDQFKENRILILFDYEKQIWVFTDASDYAIGAVIVQLDDQGRKRPVLFYSRKLLPAERNYSTPDKELLAIVQTLKKFRHYLQGTKYPVIVKTDHQNLKTFTTTKTLNGRQARWAEELCAYDFVIEHIKGKENVVADALSRRSDYRDKETKETETSLLINKGENMIVNTIKMITLENNDESLLNKIKDESKKMNDNEALEKDEKGYLKFKGLIFVPKNLENEVLQAHHDGAEHGHPGIARVMEKVQRSFYFPGMYRKTKKYLAMCEACNRNKHTRQKPQGKMIIDENKPVRPWEYLTADFVEMPSVRHVLYGNVLNALLVVVDTFSKATVLIPTRKEATTDEVYHLLWERVFAVYGIPKRMLSDRDKIFKTTRWADKMKEIGSQQILSTAHHQQTDGQSERKIQELQAYYRHYLDYSQQDWVELTPVAQFALNDVINSSTGETPNTVVYGVTRGKADENDVETSNEHSTRMKKIHEQVRLDLDWSKVKSKEYYDKKRSNAPELKVGSYVYLRRRTLGKKDYNIQTKRPSNKLDCIHQGPFKIMQALPHDNYRLALPERMRIHPESHVSLLKPTNVRSSGVEDEASDEYEVETVRAKRKNQYGGTEYLIKWAGYDSDENTWEDTTNLYCPDKVREFENVRPDRRGMKRASTLRR
jgi:reverse transcriptase-like protein/integrase-like protein/chromodomain-containing protein